MKGIVFVLSLLSAALAFASVELTVYNQGFALVKETREIMLKHGKQKITLFDIAKKIDPTSVSLRSLKKKNALRILEQNYRYDPVTTSAILKKVVGSKIKLTRTLQDGRKEVIIGTLLSEPSSYKSTYGGHQGMVLQTDDGRILLNPTGEIEVASIPTELAVKPRLIWDLNSTVEGNHPIELNYITKGISWNADFTLTLEHDQVKAGIQGWVTLNNRSGTGFKNAKLKLLAGNIKKARSTKSKYAYEKAAFMAAPTRASTKSFAQKSIADYHLYTLSWPTTIMDKEIKQVSFIRKNSIPVAKRLVIDPMKSYGSYYPSSSARGTGKFKPDIHLEFTNTEKNQLGIPLPAGRIRVFQKEESGSVQLIGEDNIQHTPTGEKLKLVIGKAFDIVAERKRTNYQSTRKEKGKPRYVFQDFEIHMRNNKNKAETVHLVERHWGEWQINNSNLEYQKIDSNTVQFSLLLKPKESRKIIFSITTKYN